MDLEKFIPKEEKAINRIDEIRKKSLFPEEINESQQELLDTRSKEIFALESQSKNLFELVKNSLPKEVKVFDKNHNEYIRKTQVSDLKAWKEADKLDEFILSHERLADGKAKDLLITNRTKYKINQVNKILGFNDQVKSMQGAVDKKMDIASLTDEQKMVRLFNLFRLKEVAQSRIIRKNYQELINSTLEQIDYAREEGRFEQIDEEFDPQINEYRHKLYEEILSSPDSYYDYWGQYLLDAKRVFDEDGKIFETPYVRSKVDKITKKVKSGGAVFIHGETGTGKTEIAKYIAKEKFGKDALVVSGRRGLEIIEMTETQDIKPVVKTLPELQRKDVSDLVAKFSVSKEFKEIIAKRSEISNSSIEEITKEELNKYEEACVEYNQNRLEITSRLQPIFQSAMEGRMVIIDEMNAIPHHTLIALNDLLTKRALDSETYEKFKKGEITIDKIKSENKISPIFGVEPFPIAPGFCFVGTGNWKPEDGQNYIGRQTLDTAFLRRFEIEPYDYLPNPTEGVLEAESISKEQERELKEKAELYQMICARVIKSDLSAELPENVFSQIENLAQVAKLIQDAFSGKNIPDEYLPESLSGSGGKLKAEEAIRENVLDLGKLVQFVINPWKKDGFRFPLEMYLFDRYISRSSARPQEMEFIYKIFQLRGMFDSSKGWPDLIDLGNSVDSSGNVSIGNIKSKRMKEMMEFGSKLDKELYGKPDVTYNREIVNAIEKVPTKFYSRYEVIEKIVGKAPERNRYPDLSAALTKEGEVVNTIEVNPEELEIRQKITSWKDGVESNLLRRKQLSENKEKLQLFDGFEPADISSAFVVIDTLEKKFDLVEDAVLNLGELLDKNASLEEIKAKKEEIEAYLTALH